MFSSNEFVQLVFANADDCYYGEDLLKLDLEQYLWRKLHENGRYSAVYFLKAEEKGFSVTGFGDQKARPFQPEKKTVAKKFAAFFSDETENEMGEWMLRQLKGRRDSAAAFVCSLKDFCRVASKPEWKGILQRMSEEHGRTGILVLTAPPRGEENARLLLESPVFELLQDRAILDARCLTPRELYGEIQKHKGEEACAFLNVFSSEHLRGPVLQAMLAGKERFLQEKELKQAVTYLVRYLNSARMQREDALFEQTMPGVYLRFRDLYDRLLQDRVWNRLIGKSQEAAATQNAGKVKAIPILRSENSSAGRCIHKLFVQGLQLRNDAQEAMLLDEVIQKLMVPTNRPENPQIAERMEHLSLRFTQIDPEDNECLKRILGAVRTCNVHLHTEQHSDEEQMLVKLSECLDNYTEVSSECRQMEERLKYLRKADSVLERKEMTMLEGKLEVIQSMRQSYQEIIDGFDSSLSIAAYSAKYDGQMQKLEERLSTFRKETEQKEQKAEPETPENPKNQKQKIPEDPKIGDWIFKM